MFNRELKKDIQELKNENNLLRVEISGLLERERDIIDTVNNLINEMIKFKALIEKNS